MNTLHPIHRSLYATRVAGKPAVRVKPINMSRIRMPSNEHREALTRVALGIFTDCTNVGVPFQDALLAIYLSGMENAVSSIREQN